MHVHHQMMFVCYSKLVNSQVSMSDDERARIMKEYEKQMVQLENRYTTHIRINNRYTAHIRIKNRVLGNNVLLCNHLISWA